MPDFGGVDFDACADGAADVELAGGHVEVPPAQGDEFAAAQADIGGDALEFGVLGVVALVLLDLLVGEGRALLAAVLAVVESTGECLDLFDGIEGDLARWGLAAAVGVFDWVDWQAVGGAASGVVEDRREQGSVLVDRRRAAAGLREVAQDRLDVACRDVACGLVADAAHDPALGDRVDGVAAGIALGLAVLVLLEAPLERNAGLGEHGAVVGERRWPRALDLFAVADEVGGDGTERERIPLGNEIAVDRRGEFGLHPLHERRGFDRRGALVEVFGRHAPFALDPLPRAITREPRRADASLHQPGRSIVAAVAPHRHVDRLASRAGLDHDMNGSSLDR